MKTFTCIECPRGCTITVDDQMVITGNSCPRGKLYVQNELTCPKRVVTSTVRVRGAAIPRVPVITSEPIPKDRMMDLMKALQDVVLDAPLHMHDVALHNALGLGVEVLVTRPLEKE